MRFLVTGATGFLGSNLTFRLLAEGAEVVALARPVNDGSGLERLERCRDEFELAGPWPPPNLRVVEGDVRRPNLDLGSTAARELFADVDQVLHCAALVDFAADRREAVLETNTGGLRNLLPLLRDSGSVLNLMSTAYVCGKASSIVPEAPLEGPQPDFRNSYEESKYLAERLVIDEMAPAGGMFRILRPSIVIGEHASGRTSSFKTLYVFLKMLDWLNDRVTRDGSRARLRVRCQQETGLNLVPVDWVTETTLAIVRAPHTAGGVYHLTNPTPARLQTLGDLLTEIYPLLEVVGADEEAFAAEPPTTRERTVDRGLAPYRSYLENHPRFDDTKTRRILGGQAAGCPPLDRDWLVRLIDYARDAKWGQAAPRPVRPQSDAADTYCESFFDTHLAGRVGSPLLRSAPQIDALFEVRLTDYPDFCRHVELRAGNVTRVGQAESSPQWRYEMSSGILRRIGSARLDPREAFYSQQIEIRGDMEAGLRFANLIVEFLRESPFEMAGEAD